MGLSALLSTQILDASATGRSVLTGASAAAIRTTLGLEITAPTGKISGITSGTCYLYQPDVSTWSVSTDGFGFARLVFKPEGPQSPADGYFAFSQSTNGNGTIDTILRRDAANTLALRNGASAQTSRIYGTYTDASNYERGFLTCDTTNGFTLGTEAAGTGTKRQLRILGPSLASAEAVSALNIVQTWNTTGTPSAFQMNVTDTASNAASLLADWKVGANSIFTVSKDGSFTFGRYATAGFNAVRFSAGAITMSRASDGGAVITFDLNGNGVTAGSLAASNGRLNLWDSWLLRDTSDILAVRNANTGTNACGFRVYNTYTDASNYERARMSWETNQFVIGHEYLGTGAARAVALVGGQTGTQGVVKASTGSVLIGAQLNLSNSSNASASTSQIVLYTPADGQLRITNSNSTTFDRLFLGLATSAFPMVKRNAAAINFRVGDDTGDCDVTAKAATFSGNVTVSAVNIVTDVTTGTRIGTASTQKIGFWNAVPLVQPTTAVGAATVTSPGAGATIKTDDQFDGYTVQQVVKALRNIGILA